MLATARQLELRYILDMIRITTFADRRVAVFGLGGSGLAAAQALSDGGATALCWDDGAAGREAAVAAGFIVEDLSTADWSTITALILAPGVPLTHPEPHWVVKKARAAGCEIIGDVELFFRQRVLECPEAPVVCITGTNGKSTTTALVAHILRTAGRDVQMGGNIGKAILTLEPPSIDRTYVIEISSFQIDLTPSLAPTVGVLLNISPDHIERHGTLANYADIKARVINSARMAVVGVEDGLADEELSDRIAHAADHDGAQVSMFSRRRAQTSLVTYCEDAKLQRFVPLGNGFGILEVLTDVSGIASLRGAHNQENAAAAFNICEWLGLAHDQIGAGMKTYPGLAHRMEEVGRAGDVLFINDSKATNAEAAEKALLSFPSDIYWILGGKPKEGGIAMLEPLFERVAKAYLIGEASEQFAATLDGKADFEICGTLDRAVVTAANDAAAIVTVSGKRAGREPVVLLSPACASYDQFKNFEMRGHAFRELVAARPDVVMREREP